MRKQKGFTLIELLVVIAIIGILAAIVLVSLSGARDRARDARIQSAMGQIRSLAELIYNDADPFSYAGLCDDADTLNDGDEEYGDELDSLESDIDEQNGAANDPPTCFADEDSYCVSVVNASDETVCVGSNGQTGSTECTDADTDCQ